MKVLYIDTENGYKTLGSKQDIQDMFGYPMLQPSSYDKFVSIMGQIFEPVIKNVEQKIGNLVVKDHQEIWSPKGGTEIDALIVDTGTELIKKLARQLQGMKKKLDYSEWAQIKDRSDKLMNMLNTIESHVVFNCHAKPDKDDDLGIIMYSPNLEGSTRNDVAKWFDFVFYTTTVTTKSGAKEFHWVTCRDERYPHAKDRSGVLDPVIPQDYAMVFAAAEERGWDTVKVLIIGSPGSGKTLSLKTMVTNSEVT